MHTVCKFIYILTNEEYGWSNMYPLELLSHVKGNQRKHDDVMKWKKKPRNWSFVQWIHRSPVNSPHKGQWRGPLMFSLICAWIYGWVNNRDAGDLRCHRAHYDVNVMQSTYTYFMGYNLHLCGLVHWGNIGYPPETYLRLKYREISFFHNLLLSC